MALSAIAWVTLGILLVLVPGIASLILIRSLRTEDRKLELLQSQERIDSYSPQALRELREWIQSHPNHPQTAQARQRYNECVRTLREIDEPYYDWSQEQIGELELLEE